MLSQPFQKLLVTEKWVCRPRGFEFLEESKLLVSTHRGFQNSHRAIQVQPSITASGRPPCHALPADCPVRRWSAFTWMYCRGFEPTLRSTFPQPDFGLGPNRPTAYREIHALLLVLLLLDAHAATRLAQTSLSKRSSRATETWWASRRLRYNIGLFAGAGPRWISILHSGVLSRADLILQPLLPNVHT
jgi:hypothetical protein